MLKNYLLAFFILFSANVITNVAQAETVPTYSPWQTQEYKKPPSPRIHNNAPDKPLKDISKQQISIIEELYTNRLSAPIKQFGYDIFTAGNTTNTAPMGAVQDDFVLGAGDTLQITFTGGRIDQDTYKVDSSGMLNIK